MGGTFYVINSSIGWRVERTNGGALGIMTQKRGAVDMNDALTPLALLTVLAIIVAIYIDFSRSRD